MLDKKINEENRLYVYKQIYKYDKDLAEKIKNSEDGYLCNVLDKKDFWDLCKLCNVHRIKI